ncbi:MULTISPECIES: hypothetical protein [unclassified Carboxylicivirga]|uniref:hypothetical protein n=1 Tax=Carboxylicivirga TaxID=1628153 RepID=UPI003D34F017
MYRVKFFLIGVLMSHGLLAQSVLVGGKLGVSFPTNLGPSGERFGFKDLSKPGMQAAIMAKWFYNERLSLGADFGYQYQGSSDVWDVGDRGDIDVSYQTLRLLLNGTYYFSDDVLRPYLGMSFGAYYLVNTMDYQSDDLSNPSTAYTTRQWKPGVAPQLGFLYALSRIVWLDCHIQFDLIQDTKPSVVYIPGYGNAAQNSHKSQNQFSVNVGLLIDL